MLFGDGLSFWMVRHSFWRSGLWTSPERLPGDVRETLDINNNYGPTPHHQRFHTTVTLRDHKWSTKSNQHPNSSIWRSLRQSSRKIYDFSWNGKIMDFPRKLSQGPPNRSVWVLIRFSLSLMITKSSMEALVVWYQSIIVVCIECLPNVSRETFGRRSEPRSPEWVPRGRIWPSSMKVPSANNILGYSE